MLKQISFRNKKAEIGETLTWIVAFLLIFFIMILFTLACTVIANVNGSPKDYVAEPVSGDISLISRFISVLNKNTMVDGKNVNLVDYIKKYPYSDVVKNDIRCMFIEKGSSKLRTEGFYPRLYIQDDEISLPQGENCQIALKDVGYSALYVSNSKAPLRVELKFSNCDGPLKKLSIASSSKDDLQKEILEMQKSGATYDNNCESLDMKKGLLSHFNSLSYETATVTTQETAKLVEILADKTDISFNGVLWKYDSKLNMWVVLNSFGGRTLNDADSMQKVIFGFQDSKNYPDILNAKKENGAWVIPLKNA